MFPLNPAFALIYRREVSSIVVARHFPRVVFAHFVRMASLTLKILTALSQLSTQHAEMYSSRLSQNCVSAIFALSTTADVPKRFRPQVACYARWILMRSHLTRCFRIPDSECRPHSNILARTMTMPQPCLMRKRVDNCQRTCRSISLGTVVVPRGKLRRRSLALSVLRETQSRQM